jgi:hypothetical protein
MLSLRESLKKVHHQKQQQQRRLLDHPKLQIANKYQYQEEPIEVSM